MDPTPEFLIWLVCDQGLRMYISQSCQVIPMLLQWTKQSEKHSLKIFWSHKQVSILFEKPGEWKHREDVLVFSLRLLWLSLKQTGTQNWNPFPLLLSHTGRKNCLQLRLACSSIWALTHTVLFTLGFLPFPCPLVAIFTLQGLAKCQRLSLLLINRMDCSDNVLP